MSGEALTTHPSLTVDLVLQVLGGYLHNRDAPMREFVDEFRAARAGDFGSSPREYQRSAAATRISFKNSLGDNRSAERAPSGTSNVIVGISFAFRPSGYRGAY
jgi:hypothetical protein